MSLNAQMYWVFGVKPSRLEDFFWTVTLDDVRTCTEVKLGEMCAVGAEMSSSLISIVDETLTALFGKAKPEPKTGPARTKDEFIKAFNRVVASE